MLLLILVKERNVIGSTVYNPIDTVNMVNVYGKHASIEYQGIVWVDKNKITSLIVSDDSVGMYMYAI